MSQLDFLEIARLINFSRTTQIDVSPGVGKDGRWGLFDGEHRVHTSVYPFKVLYIYAAASNTDIREAAKAINELNPRDIDVVHAPSVDSLARRHTEIAQLFRSAKGLWTTRDYLRSFIKDELQTYLQKITEQAPKYYVDPSVAVPAGVRRKIPNPLFSFLQEPSPGATGKGHVAILLAEPGHGKTFMSRHLVAQLAQNKSGFVPLMVNSMQWQSLTIDELGSLATTILNSFRAFGAPISWLEGHEDQFLAAALKADLFRIVFDGFDEYILRNRIQPMEVLNSIVTLASENSTRIVITSRTSFWNSNLPESEIGEFIENTGSLEYSIEPFDINQARQYFEFRLDNPAKITHAVQAYAALKNDNHFFIGRGFVLSLIADLAERAQVANSSQSQISKGLFWLVKALCEREIERQQLGLSSEEQLEIFRTFATETALGDSPTTELLKTVIELVRPSMEEGEPLDSTIDKLKSHPLIEKDPSSGTWRFKQEQIAILLLADRLMDWPNDDVSQFIRNVRFEAGQRQDLGAMIVEQVFSRYNDENRRLERLKGLIRAFSASQAEGSKDTGVLNEGRKLAAVVSLMAVEKFAPRGRERTERTRELRKLIGSKAIKGLSFTGSIAGFDFREVRFEDCSFDGAAWANCRFDEATVFDSCRILGGIPPQHCEGFGRSQFSNCKYDDEAHALINNAQVTEGKRVYSTEDLKMDIKCVLHKFMRKDRTKTNSIETTELLSGPITTSKHKTEITRALLDSIIMQDEPPSRRMRISSEAEEAVLFYGGNNVFTGKVQQIFERLCDQLNLN